MGGRLRGGQDHSTGSQEDGRHEEVEEGCMQGGRSVLEDSGEADQTEETQREEKASQKTAMMGVQQQKRVMGFCRVPARARLTACKNPLVTWV